MIEELNEGRQTEERMMEEWRCERRDTSEEYANERMIKMGKYGGRKMKEKEREQREEHR